MNQPVNIKSSVLALVLALLSSCGAQETCNIPANKRVDCGWWGMVEEQCSVRRCCWDKWTGNAPWCFYTEDIDECAHGTDNCHDLATCTNTKGSFVCTCNSGFSGDGIKCEALWQPWGVWSECSSSCSSGLQVRKRLSVFDGSEGNETRPCNTELCDKFSTDKTACTGNGRIPSACQLDAFVGSHLYADFFGGSAQDNLQSPDGKLKAKITRFKAPGMNIKFVKIRGEGKKEN